jgi:host factor-I protein
MNEKQDVLTDHLKAFVNDKARVAVYLTNGIKLGGHVIAFSKETIFLDGANVQMVFRHAISTVQAIDNDTKKKQ